MKSRHLSRVSSTSPELVHEFASYPDNLPKWAAGLVRTEVVRVGDVLLVDSPVEKSALEAGAEPETEDADRLQLAIVLGTQSLA